MKKHLIFMLAAMLCLLMAACGEKPAQPDALQTPQYSVREMVELSLPDASEIHTAGQGAKTIAPSSNTGQEVAADDSTTRYYLSASELETIWMQDDVVTYNAFTMPEKAAFDNGSIGILTISKIGLTVNVYESDNQMEDMDKGAAHFKSTSAWDGNVALSAHNSTVSGYGAYFKDLHKLVAGDTMMYKTSLGERAYTVTTVKTVADTDWSALGRTADNRLTLITCVNNDASKRLLIQAVQR